jgi:hypothetical protein
MSEFISRWLPKNTADASSQSTDTTDKTPFVSCVSGMEGGNRPHTVYVCAGADCGLPRSRRAEPCPNCGATAGIEMAAEGVPHDPT